MRKWLYLLLILVSVYFLSKIGQRKGHKSPILKRINDMLTILVWTLLAIYTVSFFYWLYTQIFR